MTVEHWCTRCGSRNHRGIDCSKATTYTPTPADLAYAEQCSQPRQRHAIAHDSRPTASHAPAAVPGPSFEPKPRFKGCPPICEYANLPSFPDEAALVKWRGRPDGEGFKLKRQWQCESCGQLHYEAQALDAHDSHLPPGFRPFMRQETVQANEDYRRKIESRVVAGDLPQQPARPKSLDHAPLPLLPSIPKPAAEMLLFK